MVEQQFDDCGADFRPLLKDLNDENINMVNVEDDQVECDEHDFFMNLTHHFGLNGCRFEADNPRDMSLGSATNNMVFDAC